jgi:iron-sulfur cluster assembly protein
MNLLELTQAARTYFCDLLEMTGQSAILLSVGSKGCGGHSYQLRFVDRDFGGEAIDLTEAYRLVLDAKSLLWLIGAQIDYVDDGLEQRVAISNPSMETGRCGCGMSFTCK